VRFPTCSAPRVKAYRKERTAAAAVEFAVVAPVLFTVVLGIIEFGRAMMVLELLNNAARSGCRVGTLSGANNNAINTAITNSLAGSGITNTTTTILVNGTQADVSTASTGDMISVSIAVLSDNVSWLPVEHWLNGRNLSGTVVMRRE
jgi:Flp pilus assembly protein TadG